AHVMLWEELRRRGQGPRTSALRSLPSRVRKAPSGRSTTRALAARSGAGSPTGGGQGLDGPYGVLPVASALDRVLLDLVGRHPFLSTETLAAVLDRDVRWVRRRRAVLVSRGLMRVVPVDEVSPPELAERELLE